MKTYTSTSGNFKADVQADTNNVVDIGYLKSATSMRIYLNTGVAAGTYVYTFSASYTPAGGSNTLLPDIEYVSAPDGSLSVSLRKFLAYAGPGGMVSLAIRATFSGNNDTLWVTLSVVDGVSYNDIAIPRLNDLAGFTGAGHAVVPPNVMLTSGLFSAIIAETSLANVAIPSADRPSGVWQGLQPGYSPVTLTPAGDRLNSLEISTKFTALKYTEGTKTRSWDLVAPDNCTDIVMLRWTSQTGAVRQHIFRVAEMEGTVDAAAGIIVAGDGYRAEKNVSRGFKVRIEGLTPSSWWYYADMVLASDLHAATPEQAAMIETEFCAAYCTDQQVVMPSGNQFVTFEANIKYRHYDSF